MAEIPDSLRSLFTGRIEEQDGRYLLEIPESEVENGAIDPSEPYRVAILREARTGTSQEGESSNQKQQSGSAEEQQFDGPPVEEGERRTVTIDDLGDQGDGIARVERGFVVIVPDVKPEDVVEIEIENVRENVAFAEVVEHKEATAASL
ncbi:TRAM domain-containing protein [Halosimplex pelagicum]|uniref:TRAM domain-containing protein n=1 Tax=Halosimplex pelagicum TaxID=869886 RepID=A0A7D5T9X1_9EURY|nr:TRAM domain-containing protein [Halosimplex pelagicum]QLH82290.1 TRAM domain-containing protein [Halosimplex pelagicum]